MTNEEAEAITVFERRLTEWMKEQPVTVEWSLMALGISAARLIFGVGSLLGENASQDAIRLLNNSIVQALGAFRRHADADVTVH
ncbi:MAG: hypothetical protein U1E42_00760 [Rhodospirillales bacterium]